MVVCGERLARFQTEKWLANSSQLTIIDQSVKAGLKVKVRSLRLSG